MTRPMSRAERKAAFMKKAEEMFTELREWYDHNPEASFEGIEQQARQKRRQMMGSALGVLVNGRIWARQRRLHSVNSVGRV